jgi:hypothetical protein
MYNFKRGIRFVSMFLVGTGHWDRNRAIGGEMRVRVQQGHHLSIFSVTFGHREPGWGSNCVHR